MKLTPEQIEAERVKFEGKFPYLPDGVKFNCNLERYEGGPYVIGLTKLNELWAGWRECTDEMTKSIESQGFAVATK